jgi:hypothetical protein
MKQHADKAGMGFVLTVYPWAHQVSDSEWLPGRYSFMPKDATPSDRNLIVVGEFAAKNGITFADLFPAFRAYHGKELLYLKHDPHWTVAGQEVMAKGLLEQLQKGPLKNICPAS